MEILRKISHAIIVGLLGLVLIVGIAAAAISLAITNPDTVKGWPVDAGIYPKLTGQLLNATERPQDTQEGGEDSQFLQDALGESPLDKDRLEKAVGGVYTAEYWQEKFETVIDSFFGWLDGSRQELEFEVVFNDRNDELAGALEAELSQQLAEYPRCPAGTNFEEFDPLSTGCLPPGVSANQAAEEFSDDIRQDDFLEGAVLSSDELDLDAELKENGPATYAAVRNLPLILSLVAGLLALLAVFSAKSRLKGMRKTGQLLFGIGLVSWLGFYIGKRVGAGFEFTPNGDRAEEEIIAEVAQPLIKAAFDDLTTNGLWVSLIVVLAGTLLWLAAFIWHKVHHSQDTGAARTDSSKAKEDPKLPKPVKPGKDAQN